MKNKLLKNKNSIMLFTLCIFSFILQFPNTYYKQYNLLLSPSVNNVSTAKLGLLSKIPFDNISPLYFILLALYFITLIILSLFLVKLFSSTKRKDDTILLSLIAIPILCHFGFSLYFTSNMFSLFSLVTLVIGTALFILSFENKHTIIITILLVLSIIIHPVIFLILFPSVFILFIINNPRPKASIIFQMIVLSLCYIISAAISFANITLLVVAKTNLLSNIYELIFLTPLIFMILYIFISAIKTKKQKKLNYYLSLLLFTLPLPLVFISNDFYIYLSASLGGQMLLLLYFYLKEDNYIVTPLKKIQTFFSKNIPAFLLLIFYLTYLAFILENHLGFIGGILRDYYL